MDIQLQKTLEDRIENCKCFICGKELDLDRPKTSLQVKSEYHHKFGQVLVCIHH